MGAPSELSRTLPATSLDLKNLTIPRPNPFKVYAEQRPYVVITKLRPVNPPTGPRNALPKASHQVRKRFRAKLLLPDVSR